jgi:hypothetical protein
MKSIFTFIVLLCVSYAFAQQKPPILERKISVSFQQEKLPSALNQIASKGGFSFSYSTAIFSDKQSVTINANNQTVREVLIQLFKGTIDYKEKDNHLILTKVSFKNEEPTVNETETGKQDVSSSTDEIKGAESNQQDSVALPMALGDQKQNTAALSSKDSLNTASEIIQPSDAGEDKKEEVVVAPAKGKHIENSSDTLYRDIQVSFLPFLGTNWRQSGNCINNYSINILGGYSLGTREIELGYFVNIDRGNVKWLQIAGFGNLDGGNMLGMQAAGFINLVGGSMHGFQAAGFLNINGKSSVAVQAAGFGNLNFEEFNGIQLAGFSNINLNAVHGASIAGFANITNGSSGGGQIAGFINVQNKDYHGSQIAGFSNITNGDVRGSQLAGFFNYGKNVKGIQVGVFNYADSLGGIPIGLISLVKQGYHKIEISADEVFYTNLAFRTGANKFYNIISASVQPQLSKDNRVVWAFGYGLGTAPRLAKWLDLNVDLTSQHVSKSSFTSELSLLNKIYLGFDFHLAKKFSIAAGVTLNGYLTKVGYENYPELFKDYRPDTSEKIYNSNNTLNNNSTNLKMWVGGKVGIRFL